jgi:hypothetical protein
MLPSFMPFNMRMDRGSSRDKRTWLKDIDVIIWYIDVYIYMNSMVIWYYCIYVKKYGILMYIDSISNMWVGPSTLAHIYKCI